MLYEVITVDDHRTIGFQPVAEGQRRMVQILGGDANATDVELTFGEIMEAINRLESVETDRMIVVGHLARERGFEVLRASAGGIDLPALSADEERIA